MREPLAPPLQDELTGPGALRAGAPVWTRRRLLLGPAVVLATPASLPMAHAGLLQFGRSSSKGLIEHHRLLADLLNGMLLEDEWPRALDTARRVRYVLDAHLLAEENALYPAAERYGFLQRPRELFTEHAQQKLGAARLEATIAAQDYVAARRACRALRDEVVGHSVEEEDGPYRRLLENAGPGGVWPHLISHYQRAFASVKPARLAWLP